MAKMIKYYQHLRDMVRELTGIGCVRDGLLVLGTGYHEIMVETGCHPERVFLTIQEPKHSHSICGNKINMACAMVTKHGFIIVADIKSNTAEIEWLVEY